MSLLSNVYKGFFNFNEDTFIKVFVIEFSYKGLIKYL